MPGHRRQLFDWIMRDVARWPEGRILPWWGIMLRWALFPVLSVRYWSDSRNGYNPERDTWTIGGITISARAFALMAKPGERLEIIAVKDGVVTMRRIETD